MINEKTHNQLQKIKRSFRLLMNGVASRSMREKGFEYKINWGIQLPDIKEMAMEYGKDFSLAVELWKENIRECKILATLIMPAEEMPRELVDIWIEQTKTQEIAEMAAFNLYQYLKFAPELAYEWIASCNATKQLSGFLLLARLFANGQQPNERGISEFLDQVQAVLESDGLVVKHAAANCLLRFCELGKDFELVAHKTLPMFV